MTTEQKAKRYDEALERAKKWYNPTDADLYTCVAESIFPELKESEDEKIRQKFIKLVKMSNEVGGFALHKWEADEMLAWLEKQGEQKPADKVEPKFQNGQWIVWQNKCYKVNYNGCGYELIDQNGLSTSLEYGTVDASARFYDVSKDAKDGDVLVFKNNIGGIIICKSPSDYDTRSYCRLIRDNLINKEESGWDSTLLVPATKEQRDTLERAITNAGYRWDKEKLKLEKI